jgi:hypothetical protein
MSLAIFFIVIENFPEKLLDILISAFSSVNPADRKEERSLQKKIIDSLDKFLLNKL